MVEAKEERLKKEEHRKILSIHYYRMTVPKRKKAHLINYEGVNFPCLPSVKEVNATLSKNIVEALHHNPLSSPKEYDVEAAEILDRGKLYIGKNVFYLLLLFLFFFFFLSLFILVVLIFLFSDYSIQLIFFLCLFHLLIL